MGTKNNPGHFDCYTAAEPDEPMFILLGRDPMAPSLVEAWAEYREANYYYFACNGEAMGKVDEARQCARAMREWLEKLGKQEFPVV